MPFIGAALFKDFALVIEDYAFDLWLNLETLWYAGKTIDNGLERLLTDRRWLGCACVFRLKNCGRFLELGFLASLPFFDGIDFVSRHLQPQSKLGFQRDGVVFAKCSGFEQLAFVKLRDRWSLLDLCVEIGLGKRRFIAFIVAIAAIAIHVDHDVAPESLAKIERNVANKFNGQRIDAVHMKNRR